MTNPPLALVTAWREVPVLGSTTVTFADPTDALDGSETVPTMVPEPCEKANWLTPSKTSATKQLLI
jgi:hypothetical protein